VCTPLGRHAADIADILEVSHPKIIWCEKPLAADLASARALVALAEEKGVRLAVTYNRRYLSFWRRVRALIEDGAIGRPAGLRVAMPNRLLSIGSHAADLLLYLAGSRPERIAPLAIPALEQDGEPAVAAAIRFESGVYGLIQVTGFKAQKIVEAEAWGNGGRIRADELSGEIEVRQFEASPHEPDYRNLGDPRIERPKGWRDESAFVAVLDEIAAMLDGTRARATSDGLSALDAQEVVEVMAAAASEGHGT
jgi:predicted dehydrogenase